MYSLCIALSFQVVAASAAAASTPVDASAHPTGQNVWTDFCSVNKHKPVSGVFVTQEGIPIERKVTKAS